MTQRGKAAYEAPLHAMLCPDCDGEGYELIEAGMWQRTCHECKGTGLVPLCDLDCDCDACVADSEERDD